MSCHFSSHCSIHLRYPRFAGPSQSPASCHVYLFHFSFRQFCLLLLLFSAHSFIRLVSSLSAYLTWDYSAVHHHPPLPIPRSFSLPCSPSLTPSTPFLSPPLCHPSIKTPTDGPEPSAQATFWPSFFSPALHAKRRPIKVRLLSFFHSVVLLSVCLHSDSLGSLIKTLYFLYSTFFFTCSSNFPLLLAFLFIFFVPPLCSNLSQHLSFHQSPSAILWAPSHVTPSLTFLPPICHTFLSSFVVSGFVFSCCYDSCKVFWFLHVKFTSLTLSYIYFPQSSSPLLFLHISLYTGNSLYCIWQEVRMRSLKEHALCSSSVLMMLSCPELLLCLKPVNLDWRRGCACACTSA